MKQKTLTHEYTPDALQIINEGIERLLGEDELNSEGLLAAATERDIFIQQYLSDLSESAREKFVTRELEVNQWLLNSVAELGKDTLIEATAQIRKRKAANKYLE